MKKTLLGLAGLALATTAMASEPKEQNTDYSYIEIKIGAVSQGAMIDSLADKDAEVKFGLQAGRRTAINEKYGLITSLGCGMVGENGFFQGNLEFSAIKDNFEFYVGPGLRMEIKTDFNVDSYFVPHVGTRWLLSRQNGFYLGAELGTSIGRDKTGLEGSLGLGIRF